MVRNLGKLDKIIGSYFIIVIVKKEKTSFYGHIANLLR